MSLFRHYKEHLKIKAFLSGEFEIMDYYNIALI